MHESYEKLEYKVLWKDLKEYLIEINRDDIVAVVEDETLITVGKHSLHCMKSEVFL